MNKIEYLLIAAALIAAIAAAVRWWFWRDYEAKRADALGDPDCMRGPLSCRHVDTRSTKPRKAKEKA